MPCEFNTSPRTRSSAKMTEHGTKYAIRAILSGPTGQAAVVVLNRDLPAHGLRRGDLGAVVDMFAPDAIEVEFGTASGRM